jgi:hypothetical protein
MHSALPQAIPFSIVPVEQLPAYITDQLTPERITRWLLSGMKTQFVRWSDGTVGVRDLAAPAVGVTAIERANWEGWKRARHAHDHGEHDIAAFEVERLLVVIDALAEQRDRAAQSDGAG